MPEDLDLELDLDSEDIEYEEDEGSGEDSTDDQDSVPETDDPEELEKGYLRHKAFTQKTQQLAELRREAEAEKARAIQMQQFLLAQAQQRQAPPREEYFDPMERALHETRALAVTALQNQQAQMFQAQANALAAQYSKDLKIAISGDDILQFGVEKGGIPLDVAAETLAARKEREARLAQTTAVKQAKKAAPPVESGASRSAPKSGGRQAFDASAASNFDRFFGKG